MECNTKKLISRLDRRIKHLNAVIRKLKYDLKKGKLTHKNCPFCGARASIQLHCMEDAFYVECEHSDCALQGPLSGTENGAIEIWNKIGFQD